MVKQVLSSAETLAVLRQHKPMLAERFGVVELALFGSTVRDEAGPDSDVDILVSLDDRPGWTRFFDVQRYLEGVLGRPVDLVVARAVRAELRPIIEAEAVRV
ncbi:MAG: nucleotidyltransferase family protein [Chloroflexi bacterium]|nr:nucleotidyltransferase family protein [Chloroflexota bacterium]